MTIAVKPPYSVQRVVFNGTAEVEFRNRVEEIMGANPTQAQGVLLFIVAFTLIAAGLAANINYIAVLVGIAVLGGSVGLFLKCKPWEHSED